MQNALTDFRTFYREARNAYHTIGAVAPSGRFLARAISSELKRRDQSVRVLEAGPGTGSLTAEIVRYIRPQDQFDIVELNARFVSSLRQRFRDDPHFHRVAHSTRILHMPVQALDGDRVYDFVISGLPLNSFPTQLVQEILQSFNRLIKPGGVLSFFEYLWLRDLRRIFARRGERHRLAGVGSVIESYLGRYEFRRDTVLINLPPALVHHLRLN